MKIFVRYTCFVTFENEGWCVRTPGAFLYKSLLASFCLQYTSYEFFYRPCNFHFNILSSFEIIEKTLSVALEVSLSIVNVGMYVGTKSVKKKIF